MMMPPPQVVGVLLKKPGQQTHPRLPPLDPQETKIKGKFIILEIFFFKPTSFIAFIANIAYIFMGV